MTDWRAVSKAQNIDVPDDQLDKIVPVLEGLEKAFEPLRASIPLGTDMWNPEDSSK